MSKKARRRPSWKKNTFSKDWCWSKLLKERWGSVLSGDSLLPIKCPHERTVTPFYLPPPTYEGYNEQDIPD